MQTVVSVKKPIRWASGRRIARSPGGITLTALIWRPWDAPQGRPRPAPPAVPRARARASSVEPPERRPARTLQEKAFELWMLVFGSPDRAPRSFALSPVVSPLVAPVPRHRDLMHEPAVDPDRPHPLRHARPPLDLRALGPDGHPVAVGSTPDPPREDRVDLGEHRGLELGEPGKVARHRPGRVVLREAERRADVRVARVASRVVRIQRVIATAARRGSSRRRGRARCAPGDLDRLVVGRHRPVEQRRSGRTASRGRRPS